MSKAQQASKSRQPGGAAGLLANSRDFSDLGSPSPLPPPLVCTLLALQH